MIIISGAVVDSLWLRRFVIPKIRSLIPKWEMIRYSEGSLLFWSRKKRFLIPKFVISNFVILNVRSIRKWKGAHYSVCGGGGGGFCRHATPTHPPPPPHCTPPKFSTEQHFHGWRHEIITTILAYKAIRCADFSVATFLIIARLYGQTDINLKPLNYEKFKRGQQDWFWTNHTKPLQLSCLQIWNGWH